MSIIGTRPPLISETNLYELHHRARLAIKPGITGMWQVSGRSDITDFEEVVRLDKEYIEKGISDVELPESARKELDERFVLIYTGQRRLARNLLRDVVGRYVGNEPDSLFALEEIQKTAALMRFELERGNVDGFAKLLDYHWELSKKVDAGSSNTLIEQIFSSIEEMIDGRLVCGAGGGGFLQVILKKGITREDVEKRLNEVFMDSLVGVADCKLVW